MSATFEDLCLNCMEHIGEDELVCPHCGWRREAQALVPGSVLHGKYLIGCTLGQGGFGITYIAWDIAENEKIAIKEYFPLAYAVRDQKNHYTVNPRRDCDLEFGAGCAGFLKEADNLKKFNSEVNIVHIKDSFSENNTKYIAMEFVNGNTLEKYLNDLGRAMLLVDAVALLKPIAEALERIHAQGLVHRDISPDNIMITESGNLKILDFGAARKPNVSGGSLSIVLKIHYAPPEQFEEKGTQGPWTDVYAFAATIYDLITRRPPLQTYLMPSKLRGLDGYELVSLSKFGIPITPEQERVIMKGLAINRADRYQTVSEFYKELMAVTDTEPLTQKCVAGHFFDVKKHDVCPYCHPNKPTGSTNKKNLLLYVLTTLSVVAALFFGTKYNHMVGNYDNILGEKNAAYSIINDYKKLGYDDVKKRFGYGSEKYYAAAPVLVLTTRGVAQKLPIYFGMNGTIAFNEPSGKLKLQWGDFKDNFVDVSVSGREAGIYPVHFSNEVNKDAFDVLVVVK